VGCGSRPYWHICREKSGLLGTVIFVSRFQCAEGRRELAGLAVRAVFFFPMIV